MYVFDEIYHTEHFVIFESFRPHVRANGGLHLS